MILVLRQIADMLWEYKIAHIVAAVSLLLFNILLPLLQRKYIELYTYRTLFILTVCIVYFSIAFSASYNDYTLLSYFKIISSILMVLVGLLDNSSAKTIRTATYFSIILVICNFIAATTGIGFQTWGDSNTYSGIYFFKTDLALAVTISLSLILCADWLKNPYKWILVLLCMYLVVISNARAYYVISFIILIIFLLRDKLEYSVYYVVPAFVVALTLLSFLFVALPKVFGEDLLMLDMTLDGFYSDANTQGRSGIWDAMLGKFLTLDYKDQIFGIGLDGDIILTGNALDNELTGASSHNGYLYVLVSLGWIGLFAFLTFIFNIIKVAIKLLKHPAYKLDSLIPLILTFHLVIYMVSNLSSSNFIFQQESWFFMYFVGCGLSKVHRNRETDKRQSKLTPDAGFNVKNNYITYYS